MAEILMKALKGMRHFKKINNGNEKGSPIGEPFSFNSL